MERRLERVSGAWDRRLEGVRDIDGLLSESFVVKGEEIAFEFLIEPGRRRGGGGGTLNDDWWLVVGCKDVRSCVELLRLLPSMSVRRLEGMCGAFGSETGRPWRRDDGGAGASLRRIELEGEGGSGVLPIDSRSKTDSRSES